MSPIAPGVYVTVEASAASLNSSAPTGTWFVTGETEQGPTGVAVPIGSLNDYLNYLGPRVSYGFLYDSLDEFFHDGGVTAYVSRVVAPDAAVATITLDDKAGSPLATLSITASGGGLWGNSLSVIVATGSVSNSYTLQILNAGSIIATSPNLFSPQDAVTWSESLPIYQVQVVIANLGSATTAPNNNPANGTFTLASGSDGTTVTEAQWTAALTAFNPLLGPGQVSAPGHTTTNGYSALLSHAIANNRVALLDVTDSATAASLVTQAQDVQALSLDASYCALLGPWIVIPGIFSTNPGTTSPIPTRTVPPSACAAALMSLSDQNATNTANTPAAGANGTSTYAIGLTQTYSNADLGTLNNAGLDIFKLVQSDVTLYGYNSLSTNPAWLALNNVRFRMEIVNDCDAIAEQFVFQQIDGKGQLFALFNGALVGQLTSYWGLNALYGATPGASFSVNTGPQVNTPETISAGELNAQIGVVMSPYAEFVYITITKYPVSTGLPA